jgi:hypothetical protein
MPALIPVDNTLGALFIGTVLASMCVSLSILLQDLIKRDRRSSVYGVTWLQVYSYYNSHCSRDRWPLKSFVSLGSLRALSYSYALGLNKVFAGRFFDVYLLNLRYLIHDGDIIFDQDR